jgi:hypothetical protein
MDLRAPFGAVLTVSGDLALMKWCLWHPEIPGEKSSEMTKRAILKVARPGVHVISLSKETSRFQKLAFSTSSITPMEPGKASSRCFRCAIQRYLADYMLSMTRNRHIKL